MAEPIENEFVDFLNQNLAIAHKVSRIYFDDVETREDVVQEMILDPAPLRLGDVATVDQQRRAGRRASGVAGVQNHVLRPAEIARDGFPAGAGERSNFAMTASNAPAFIGTGSTVSSADPPTASIA